MTLGTKAALPKSRSIKKTSSVSTSFAHKNILLFLVAVLLIVARPAIAENRDGAFTFSPFAGGQGFPFNGDSHYDADFNWGARGGYNITPNLRTELVFGVNKTVHDPEVAYCTIYQYGADLLYAFRPDKDLVPFLSAGFGMFDVKFNGDIGWEGPDQSASLSDEINPYFNYGAGLEYALTSWVALRAEIHHAITLNSGDNAVQGTLGLTFQF